MKKAKKVFAAVGITILAGALTFAGVFFAPYKNYKAEQRTILTETPTDTGEIRVMSANVRCISPTDLNEKSWFNRASMLISSIEKQAPAIIGFQEVTKYHYGYLCNSLPSYDATITYRDNGVLSEGCPIFYRTDLYTLIEKGTFWLSETPDVMSKSWGAMFNRVCGYVILETKSDNSRFVVFNTHLDHVSEEARINGIGVVLDKIREFGDIPAILMGDMNANENSQTYTKATETFVDTRHATENTSDACTFQNWGTVEKWIDYCFVSEDAFTVNSFAVVTDTYDGAHPSDHNPLSVSLTLNK
ncbi:MAG: endonuclease/exonuclease/phosphatase family protein [Clostridia bacterium]|nr:endonuclease/exonuclease/phosphatase family protein [Clostridia bacterium]